MSWPCMSSCEYNMNEKWLTVHPRSNFVHGCACWPLQYTIFCRKTPNLVKLLVFLAKLPKIHPILQKLHYPQVMSSCASHPSSFAWSVGVGRTYGKLLAPFPLWLSFWVHTLQRGCTDQSLLSAYCKSLFSALIFRLSFHFYSHVIYRLLPIGDFQCFLPMRNN